MDSGHLEGLELENAPISWELRELHLGVYFSEDLRIKAFNSAADSSPLSLVSLSTAEPDCVSRPVARCNSKVTHSDFPHICGYLDLASTVIGLKEHSNPSF